MEVLKQQVTLLKAVELIQLYIEEQIANKNEIVSYPILVGAPGIGKSSVISQLAKELGFEIKTEHPALRPLEYFSGIPELVKREGEIVAKWSRPELIDFSEYQGKRTIWFLDDVHLMDAAQAKYLFEILTYRKLQGYLIPDEVVIILAGNYSKQAGFKGLLSPILNRLAVFQVKNTLDDWFTTYVNRIPIKETIQVITLTEEKADVHPVVVAFLEKYPEYAVEQENTQGPFGTLRSWTFLGRILTRYEKHFNNKPEKEKDQDTFTLAAAHISERAAAEFTKFV